MKELLWLIFSEYFWPLLSLVLTFLLGHQYVTKKNISNTNITQSRLKWLQVMKKDFTDLNNTVLSILNLIDHDIKNKNQKNEIGDTHKEKEVDIPNSSPHTTVTNIIYMDGQEVKQSHHQSKSPDVNNESYEHKSYLETLEKLSNKINQNLKPIPFYNETEAYLMYKHLGQSNKYFPIEVYWSIYISNFITAYGQYIGGYKTNNYEIKNDYEEDGISQIKNINMIYNIMKSKAEMLTEIQTVLTKIEWEKIKNESYSKSRNEKEFIKTLKQNLYSRHKAIEAEIFPESQEKEAESYRSKTFFKSIFKYLHSKITENKSEFNSNQESQTKNQDVNKVHLDLSSDTVYNIIARAIRDSPENIKLPDSMLTPSGRRYIYTNINNDTHPNGRKLFNPKPYPSKDNPQFIIETNYSKNYAHEYANVIANYKNGENTKE